MIQVRLTGGVGNQLFGWAYGQALARRTGYDVQYTTVNYGPETHRKYMLPDLGLTVKDTRFEAIYWSRVGESGFKFDPAIQILADATVVLGYFQSWKYFADCESEIRKTLRDALIGVPPFGQFDYLLHEVSEANSCFIHVRRGDYLKSPHLEFHGVLEQDYYNAAMAYVRERNPNVWFILFSDDTAWCAEKFPDIRIVEADEAKSLALMSRCKHAILANSSFSWWGAYARNTDEKALTIAPRTWFANQRMQDQTEDLCPSEWIRL